MVDASSDAAKDDDDDTNDDPHSGSTVFGGELGDINI
jgi:hypothetical protein